MSKTLKTSIFLIATVVTTLFLVSPDAPTHALWSHCDSAWFFMCGKAWMNGMTPYADFTDSKGPLLWLVYGIGYLLSPHSYTGVFWLSAAAYAVTMLCTYATARIFTGSDRRAALVAVAMLTTFFYPQVHFEVRCEDFNMMFIAIALWQTCRLLYADGGKNEKSRQCRSAAWWCGIGMAATLLIKYNASPMFLPMVLAIALWAKRNRCAPGAPLFRLIIGAATVLLPFIAVLAWQGALQAFWQEYFVNTFTVVDRSHGSVGSSWQRYLLHWVPLSALLGVSTLGALWLGLQMHRYRLFPVATVLTIAGISFMHATWTYQYGICLILPVFALCAFSRVVRGSARQHRRVSMAVVGIFTIAVVGATVFINWHKHGDALWFKDDPRSHDFARFSQVMRQVKQPKVLYYFTGPSPEHGIEAESLPACRYWASQSGATTLMDKQQRDVARSGNADFIFAAPGSDAARELEALGYNCLPSTAPQGKEFRLNLYSRHKITPTLGSSPNNL